MDFLESIRLPVVSVLPTASANTGKLFEQGNKLWFSNGTAWVDLSLTRALPPNGTYGMFTVSGDGDYWELATASLTLNKIVPITNQYFLANNYGYTESPGAVSPATVKSMLGIDLVDNTSDANKPVSTAQATAIALKVSKIGTATDYDTLLNDTQTFRGLNTTANRPADWTAGLNLYYDAIRGVQIAGSVTTNNLYFRRADSGVFSAWFTLYHTGNFDPALKANLASPPFTGVPTAPTAAPGTNTTQLATTAFVAAYVASGPYVLKAGDIMTGALDINGQALRVRNWAGTPADGVIYFGDAATDHYIFKNGGNYQIKGTFGTATLNAGGVIWTANNFTPGSYVLKAGDTMTGTLDVPMLKISGGVTQVPGSIATNANWGLIYYPKVSGVLGAHCWLNAAGNVVVMKLSDTGALTVAGGGSGVTISDRTTGRLWQWYGTGDVFSLHDGGGANLLSFTTTGVMTGGGISDAASASTLVKRTVNGYIFANYINTTADITTTVPSHVAIFTGSDNYIRQQTLLAFRQNSASLAGPTANLNADEGTTKWMRWKNYGTGHIIFDASAGTSPTGSAVNNTNAEIAWGGSYPNLMGWNGVNTYGLRVDSARIADTLASNPVFTGLIRLGTTNEMYVSAVNTNTLNGMYGVNANGDMWVNYRGYLDGITQFRDFHVGNGKNVRIASFIGSTNSMMLYTAGNEFYRAAANSATQTRQPRHFVQPTDPGPAAADGDVWTNTA